MLSRSTGRPLWVMKTMEMQATKTYDSLPWFATGKMVDGCL
jgi:hypothetical protein